MSPRGWGGGGGGGPQAPCLDAGFAASELESPSSPPKGTPTSCFWFLLDSQAESLQELAPVGAPPERAGVRCPGPAPRDPGVRPLFLGDAGA